MLAQKSLAADEATLPFEVSDALSEEGVLDLTGTFTATLVVEGSVDGLTWRTLALTPLAGGAAVTSVTAPGGWKFDLAGIRKGRVRVDTFASGTVDARVSTSRKAA